MRGLEKWKLVAYADLEDAVTDAAAALIDLRETEVIASVYHEFVKLVGYADGQVDDDGLCAQIIRSMGIFCLCRQAESWLETHF